MINGILQIFRTEQRRADLDLRAVDPLAASGFLPLDKSQYHAESARDSAHEVGMLGSRLRRRRRSVGIVPQVCRRHSVANVRAIGEIGGMRSAAAHAFDPD